MATPRPIDLAGRVILVTGGSRGLGREMALALADAGATLAITATRQSPALDRTVADLRAIAGTDRAISMIADVADPADCKRAVADTVARFGRLDALVNNAGLGMRLVSETFNTDPPNFWQTSPDTWRRIVDVNFNGAFYMAAAAARVMVGQGNGKIINISTSDQTMVRRGYAPYGPSKAGLEAASRIWAQDLAGTGVEVNVYLPGGASDTNFIPGGARRKGADGQLLPAAIMRRGIVWLCSDQSDGHTGNRYIARHWNPDLPPARAAEDARSEPAAKPAIL
ncbi:MAG: SDR family oxidoreductase [Pseudomonadota bacterium]